MMKIKTIPFLLIALLGVASCVKVNNELGGNFVPVSQTYKILSPDPIELEVRMDVPDSLSGFSNTRIAIGAIRKDSEFGLSRRACALSLVPIEDSLDFGESPVFRSFHFGAAADSVSVEDENQAHILQNLRVYELSAPVTSKYNFNCNEIAEHKNVSIAKGSPVLNGTDSMSFNFTEEFGRKYLTIKQEDLKDLKTYLKKFPGIYLETDSPTSDGGRINHFKLQLDFNADQYTIKGNYATLNFRSTYKGVQKDTGFVFYFSPNDIFDTDSLLLNLSPGSLPQSCKNITIQDEAKTAANIGPAGEVMTIEGGGGVKPVVSAKFLRDKVKEAILADGNDPSKAIINKATLTFPVAESDPQYKYMYKVPVILSPTVRVHYQDTTEKVTIKSVKYGNLTDASATDENQGDLDRSHFKYAPDITYHMQEILLLEDDDEDLLAGEYDIWMLILSKETITTTTSSDNDMADYYQALAYQNYYSSMYGGYGYGGYGYGDSYSNYYTYMMMAQYASSSYATTNTESVLDISRYYYAKLYGPTNPDETLRPTLKFTYSVPENNK